MQRRQVVKHPERSTVRRGNEIVLFHGKVVDRNDRQVHLQRLPIVAIVKAHVEAGLCARIEQPFAFWIFAAKGFPALEAGDTAIIGL